MKENSSSWSQPADTITRPTIDSRSVCARTHQTIHETIENEVGCDKRSAGTPFSNICRDVFNGVRHSACQHPTLA